MKFGILYGKDDIWLKKYELDSMRIMRKIRRLQRLVGIFMAIVLLVGGISDFAVAAVITNTINGKVYSFEQVNLNSSIVYKNRNSQNPSENNYTSDWRYWSQGATKKPNSINMNESGCRIVACSKLLREAGFDIKNPDEFLEWCWANNCISASPNVGESCKSISGVGGMAAQYAKTHGGTATKIVDGAYLNDNVSSMRETLMNYLRQGYSILLHGDGHTVYIGREDSLKEGNPIILDSIKDCVSSSVQAHVYNGKKDYIYNWRLNQCANFTQYTVWDIKAGNGNINSGTDKPDDMEETGEKEEQTATGLKKGTVSDGKCYLRNKATGQYLNASTNTASTANNSTKLCTYGSIDSSNTMQFNLKKQSDGYYKIQLADTGYAVNFSASTKAMHLYSASADLEEFSFVPVNILFPSMGYYIKSVSHPDLAITQTGKSAQVYLKSFVKSADQIWYIDGQAAKITDITIAQKERYMAPGDTYTLTTYVEPSSSASSLTWITSNASVATVSGGTIKAQAPGTCKITAQSSDGSKSASCNVTVRSVVKAPTISVSKKEYEPYENITISWNKQNAGEKYNVVITGKKAGTILEERKLTDYVYDFFSTYYCDTYTVTVTAYNEVSEAKASATFVVTDEVHATDIKMNTAEMVLKEGETGEVRANLTPYNSTDKVTWVSDNTKVATVDSKGHIDAVGDGQCTITASIPNGKKTTCKVTVHGKLVTPTLIQSTNNCYVGDEVTFRWDTQKNARNYVIRVTDVNEYTVLTESVTGDSWTYTPDREGEYTVSLTVNNGGFAKKTSLNLSVEKKSIPADTIQLSKKSLTLAVGAEELLTATISPIDTTDTIIWSSSNEKVVRVSANGNVTAVAEGSGKITATTTSGLQATCSVTVRGILSQIQIWTDQDEVDVNETVTIRWDVDPSGVTIDRIAIMCDGNVVKSTSLVGTARTYKFTPIQAGVYTISVTAKNSVSSISGEEYLRVGMSSDDVTVDFPHLYKDLASKGLFNLSEPTEIDFLYRLRGNPKEGDTVTWQSSNPDIAEPANAVTVWDNPGTTNSSKFPGSCVQKLKIYKEGTFTITATLENGYTYSETYTVLYSKIETLNGRTDFNFDGESTPKYKVGDTMHVSWKDQDSVDYYKVQISNNDGTSTIIEDEKISSIEYLFNTEGRHSLRIYGINEAYDKYVSMTSYSFSVQPQYPHAKSIDIDADSLSLMVGNTETLLYQLYPATSMDEVTWASSDESVAVVEDGTVTALSSGECTITATAASGVKAECLVKVYGELVKPVLDVKEDGAVAGNEVVVEWDNEENQDYLYSIISPSGNMILSGIKVTDGVSFVPEEEGDYTIIVNSSNGMEEQDSQISVSVSAKQIPAERVVFADAPEAMVVGTEKEWEVNLFPYDTTDTIKAWTSSDRTVAAVSDGIIKAVGMGTCTITVETSNGIVGSRTLTVCEKVSDFDIVVEKDNCSIGDTLYVEWDELENIDGYSLAINGDTLFENESIHSYKFVAESAGQFVLTVRANNAADAVEKSIILTVDEGNRAEYLGSQLVLDGYIHVNHFVSLTEDKLDSSSYVQFDNGKNTTSIRDFEMVEDRELSEDPVYCFNYDISPVDFAKAVTMRVVTQGETVLEQVYSVTDYVRTIIDNAEDRRDFEEVIPLVKALVNYCAYSQIYFEVDTDHLANEGVYAQGTDPVTNGQEFEFIKNAVYPTSIRHESEGLAFYGASLVCNSGTDLKLYFRTKGGMTASEALERYDFRSGYGPVMTVQTVGNDMMTVKLNQFSIDNLAGIYEFEIINKTNDADYIKMEYSPITYILGTAKTGNSKLANLARAMYFYCEEFSYYIH